LESREVKSLPQGIAYREKREKKTQTREE
jgi:hypothetical protein